MSLRKEEMPLVSLVALEEVEKFFNKKGVKAKLNSIVKSRRFQIKFNECANLLERMNEKLEENFCEDEAMRNLTDREYFWDSIILTIKFYAISKAVPEIIFNGKDPEEAVISVLTPDFVFYVSSEVVKTTVDNCQAIIDIYENEQEADIEFVGVRN